MRREFSLNDSKIILILVLFILIPSVYDLSNATGLDFFVKLGIVISGLSFLFVKRFRDFFFLAMVLLYLGDFISRRFLN